MKKIFSSIILTVSLLMAAGCGEDYLERVPTNSVTDEDLFSTVAGAETALNGIHRSTYAFYDNHGRFGQKSIDIIIDFMGDDMLQLDRGYGWFVAWYQYLNNRNANSADLEFAWSYYYDIIDNANLLLRDIDKASDASVKEDLVKNIKGQALAYRAHSYWALVQMFAYRYKHEGGNSQPGVPLLITHSSDPLPRATVEEVYKQINTDIDQAITLLTESEISRPNKSHINSNVAQGLKARIALTAGDWAAAADMANKARQGFALTSDYKNGWNDSNDSEWMWGALLIDEQQTSYASFFSQIDPLFGGYATMGSHKLGSTEIIDYMADSDQRKQLFQPEKYFSAKDLSAYFGNKERAGYKFTGNGAWTNDYIYMKSGEMYLIEAEAFARLKKDTEAQTVIFDLTKNRDPEAEMPTETGDALIQHILMERRCDLWGDGFRLFDIKRLNIDMDRRNKGHNETFWDKAGYFPAGDKNLLFLIPKQELDSNPNMEQNPL